MESPTRPILSPPKILHPVSPERMNQQTIPASPSLPTDLLSLHHKNTKGVSEVQAKVAFLNSLSRGGSPVTHTQSAAHNAALQRAILGREEAESALTAVQEEFSEAQSRERRISERLESLLEELHAAKERQAHERSIFEKEVRKARKEAFRAGSNLVKLQEELKHSKSESKALKDEVAAERESKDKAKQEAFERAYALAGLTEELDMLKGKLRSMEAANKHLKELRKENFGRVSLVEGDLAFLTTPRRPKRAAVGSVKSPVSEIEENEVVEATPPKRQRLSECTTTAGTEEMASDISPSDANLEALEEMRDELEIERRRRIEAEDMIHFMNIECQFQRCSCRIAESQGRRYIYDTEYYETFQRPQIEAEAKAEAARHARSRQIQMQQTQLEQVAAHPHSSHTPSVEPPAHVHHEPELQSEHVPGPAPVVKPEPVDPPENMQVPEEPLVTFSPETGTFRTFPSPLRDNVLPRRTDSFPIADMPALKPSTKSWRDSAASSNYAPDTFSPSEEPRTSRATAESIFSEGGNSRLSVESRPSRRTEREPIKPTVSAMKRVPLREESGAQIFGSSGLVPDTPINREDALAQIAARRDRARSKQRSVSENEATGRPGSTATRGPRRMPNLRADGKPDNDLAERRDLSAPVRMYRR
ncbi:hypothetical protein F1880_006044 [Penicillium rolfsii]|nr:hypothetical protein F1880_006044 [Penicillium rolfsii]